MSDQDSLQDLVAECIELLENEGPGALEDRLAGHPRAAEIRDRLAILSDSGLIVPSLTPTVPGYDLEYGLGVGGMGEVWAARDAETGQPVAIKTLRGDLLGSSRLVKRLVREAETVARLKHPVVVPVIASGESSIGPWFAMPRINGVSIDRVLAALSVQKKGEFDLVRGLEDCGLEDIDRNATLFRSEFPAAVAWIGSEIADALSAAHAAGILHRDIKPSNIMITPRGEIALIDFGLARDELQSRITATETPLGSLAYMPPEQREGSRELDATADIHALGATLFELLTQSPPRVRSEDSEETSKPPLELAPGGLDAVIEAAIRPRPVHRYQRASALRDDLRRVFRGRLPQPPQIPWTYRIQVAIRRRPVAATLGAVAFGGAVVLIAAFGLRGEDGESSIRSDHEISAEEEKARHDLARRLAAIDVKNETDVVKDEERRALNQAVLECYGPTLKKAPEDIPDDILSAAAHACRIISVIGSKTGRFSESDWAMDKALELYRERLRREPTNGPARASYASILRLEGQRELNNRNFEQAYKSYRAAFNEFTKARSQLPETRRELADRRRAGVLMDICALGRIRGDHDQIIEDCKRAMEITDSRPGLSDLALSIRGHYVLYLEAAGRLREAREAGEEHFPAMKSAVADPDSKLDAATRARYLTVLSHARRFDEDPGTKEEIEAQQLEIIRLQRECVAKDPKNIFTQGALAVALNNYAANLVEDDRDESVSYLEEAEKICLDILEKAENFDDVAETLSLVRNSLGCHLAPTDPARSEKLLKQAIAAMRAHIDREPQRAELYSRYGGAHSNLTEVLWNQKRWPETRDAYLEAIRGQMEALKLAPRTARYGAYLRHHVKELRKVLRILDDRTTSLDLADRLSAGLSGNPRALAYVASLYLADLNPAEESHSKLFRRAKEGALKCLESAVEAGYPGGEDLRRDQRYRKIWDEPRFLRLTQED